jgi:hypothetical protein
MISELLRFRLDPGADALGGGGGGAAEPAEPVLNTTAESGLSPEQLAAPPGATEPEPSQDAIPGVSPASPAQTAPDPASATPTIRDAARHYGLDLSGYEDDGQAFAALVQLAQRAQAANYYADLGQAIAPHYKEVQDYLTRKQAESAPPAERKPWEPPEFDEKWLGYVQKDPNTGLYTQLPGAPPWIAEKVQAYADHLEKWTTQLARDPMTALTPIVNHLAEQLLEQRFGQQAAHYQAQAIVQQNEGWLYATDPQGRRKVGPDGKYVPTPLGARYYTHLQTLRASGVTDATALDTLAKQLLQADIYASQAQGAAAEPTPQATAATTRPNVNPGQAVPPVRRPTVPGATEPETEGLSLRDQLALAMAEEGITDADFHDVYGS